MTRSASILPLAVLVLSLGTTTADARFAGHGGGHGRPSFHSFSGRRGPLFVFGGPTLWDPFYYPHYYPYPYPYPYSYPNYVPYPAYTYPPPPEDPGWSAPPAESPPPSASRRDQTEEAPPASYGLVQLRGVPDGAAIELDGRFWLTAAQLETRWLAIPKGEHRLIMRVGDTEPVDRRVNVEPGRNQVVRFDRPVPPPA